MRLLFFSFLFFGPILLAAQADTTREGETGGHFEYLSISRKDCPFVKNLVLDSGRISKAYYTDMRLGWYGQTGLEWNYYPNGKPAEVNSWPVSRRQKEELAAFGILNDSIFFYWPDSAAAAQLNGTVEQNTNTSCTGDTFYWITLVTKPQLAVWDEYGNVLAWSFSAGSGAVSYFSGDDGQLGTVEYYEGGKRLAIQSWYDNGALFMCGGFSCGCGYEMYDESGQLIDRYPQPEEIFPEAPAEKPEEPACDD